MNILLIFLYKIVIGNKYKKETQMKKLNLFFTSIMFVSVFLFSCSSDDDSPAVDDGANAEEREIPVAELTSGITIPGAKMETGTPPSPSGALNFVTSTAQKEAFLNNGFNISFTSTGAVAGAYIQFQDVNGNAVPGYFDIPSTAFNNGDGNKTSGIKGKKKTLFTSKMNEEGELEINVDFEETVSPGKFCYAICIYDAEGNISQIEEVCVEVESWGGNTTIVGEWIFDREEPTDPENNDTTTIQCENGSTLTDIPYNMEEKDEWIFVLNEDGSYYETYDEKGKNLDIQQSQTSCTAVYTNEYMYNDKYSGNWAFNEEAGTLTVVDFKYENLLNTEQNEEYTDGSLYFEGAKVEVIDGELVITGLDGDPNEKVIFKRK